MEPTSNACVAVLDFLMSFLVISTCVVFFWRGTWGIFDAYLYPDNMELSAWICFTCGNFVLIFTGLLQTYISRINTFKNIVVHFILSRLHIYIISTGSVAQWRGIWNLQDHYTGTSWQSALTSTIIGSGVICCLRCTKSIMTSAPLLVAHDTDHVTLFRVTGRLGSEVGNSPRFMVDMVMTPLLVHTFVVVFWRGLWSLMNIYLYPEDDAQSGIYSLVAGLALAYPTVIGQHLILPFVKNPDNKHSMCRVLLLNLYLVMASCLPVAHWRGIWFLQDAWLIPENKVISAWMSHTIGFLGGVLVLSSKSIPVSGCFLDSSIGKDNQRLINLTYFKKLWDNVCNQESAKCQNGHEEKDIASRQNYENNNKAIEFTYITHL
ncbi:uncharacterized protein LOC110462754 [Mizuhopecten yessoensis]|uniref:Uncharacterized protein n=1 Tax=Mizuhopecten yessoensis TaxID=6573 RepID=A0A210PXL2_MIZYE|nr:uncharacterized protein LOC110462754 [Mizuhopecten yessoensis]OWF41227.1 hypothetical protein KP79_PYT21407 [Mizuhopecten yessoensis]